MANTLAYYDTELITAVKSFMIPVLSGKTFVSLCQNEDYIVGLLKKRKD
jgi:hypothetical protein